MYEPGFAMMPKGQTRLTNSAKYNQLRNIDCILSCKVSSASWTSQNKRKIYDFKIHLYTWVLGTNLMAEGNAKLSH